ncbi:putative NAD dependent epimerase/dehydratase [Xylariomycetidae sp. FL2044]|nr:putative NAD dependent epimerase/dehydratase [Xylariomycetidae sp. FL2044]
MSAYIQNKLQDGGKLRLFITGATGYIGQVLTEKAIAEGHQVYGLSRNEEGDGKLRKLGATAVRGTITDVDVLERESRAADAVLHLAWIHDFSLDFAEVAKFDMAAVDAMAKALKDTGKPLIMTSGLGFIAPDPDGNETDETALAKEGSPFRPRVDAEAHGLAKDGVHSMSLRLAPYVYGRRGKGFLLWQMSEALKHGESLYVGDGSFHTTNAHVDDVARMYLAAIRYGKAGQIYNCSSQTNVTLKELAEAIGKVMDVPVRSATLGEVTEKWGPFLTNFNYLDIRGGSRKAREQLHWNPKEIDFLSDATTGSYVQVAKAMKQ